MHNITVSVIVVTYNHEKYIAKAIESILSQKTDFEFELIIGEDCSIDSTRNIIMEYQKKYPDIIYPIYYKHNVGVTRNAYYTPQKARGKYIAFCDGDDFWCDDRRLQRDVEFLDSHKEYVAICNRCRIVNEEGMEINEKDVGLRSSFWEFKHEVYSLKKFENWEMPGHNSALTARNIFLNKKRDFRIIYQASNRVADRTVTMLLSVYGNIYCDSRKVSCYRFRISPTQNNFMSQYKYQNLKDEDFLMIRRLEHWAWKEKRIRLDLRGVKKDRLVGSVVIFLRNPSWYNFNVVRRIVRYSGEPLKYIFYILKVWLLKMYYWKVKKKDEIINL